MEAFIRNMKMPSGELVSRGMRVGAGETSALPAMLLRVPLFTILQAHGLAPCLTMFD